MRINYIVMKQLHDKVIFLTGGSFGIGYTCAKAYVAVGTKVIADACVFLLSESARFITGHILAVSGGAELGNRRVY